MNDEEKLLLKRMIDANQTVDNTEKIRTLKHSEIIRTCVQNILLLKKKYSRLEKSNFKQFKMMCVKKAEFLHDNYNDLYNKVLNNEMNMDTLNQFLDILSKIENGELTQHEGSYKVGQILKKLYVDSALMKENKEKTKKNGKHKKTVPNTMPKKISWNDYKNMI